MIKLVNAGNIAKNKQIMTKLSLCLILLIDSFCIGFIMPSLANLLLNPGKSFLGTQTSLSLRHFYYNLGISLPTVFICFGALIIGALSDFIGRKLSLLISLSGIALSCLFSAVGVNAHSILLFLVGRILMGIMDGNEAVAQACIAEISHAENKTINMSYLSLSISLGFILGPLFSTILNQTSHSFLINPSLPFYLSALALFFVFIFTICFFKFPARKIINDRQHIFSNVFQCCITAIKSEYVRPIILILFCIQVAWGIYFQSASAYFVNTFNPPYSATSHFFLVMAVTFVLTFTVLLRLAVRYFNSYYLISAGLVLINLSASILLTARSYHSIYDACITVSMGVGISYNTILALISNKTDQGSQGQAMGLSLSFMSAGWIVALILSSIFSTNYKFCFTLMIVFCMCAFYQLFKYIKISKSSQSTSTIRDFS